MRIFFSALVSVVLMLTTSESSTGETSDSTLSAPTSIATVSVRIPLIEAVKRSDTEAVAALMIGNTIIVDDQDSFGRTALHYAARLGHPDIVRLLIESGAKLEAKDEDNYTPLLRAVQGGDANIHVVMALLDAGADRNARAGALGTEEIASSVGAELLLDILAR